MDSDRNPDLILIDSSSLLPLIYCLQGRLLRLIKEGYGLQFGIVQAVNSEVQRRLNPPSKFAGRQEALRKAVENRTLIVLHEDWMKARYDPLGVPLFRSCNEKGEVLHCAGLDRGEAYTYGASLVLRLLVVNDDNSALRRLRRDESDVPVPHLRFWDLLVFGLQSGLLAEKECDVVRSQLLRLSETLPDCFRKSSVHDGLHGFFCRIIDPTKPPIGAHHCCAN